MDPVTNTVHKRHITNKQIINELKTDMACAVHGASFWSLPNISNHQHHFHSYTTVISYFHHFPMPQYRPSLYKLNKILSQWGS